MLYWLTGTANSTARIYYENMHSGTWPHHEETNTITHWTDFDTGGHFAGFETPDLLVDDVRQFFRGPR
jgi:epoxide hydrolase